MSRSTILPISAVVLLAATLSSGCSGTVSAPDNAQAMQTVTAFEEEMRRGPIAADLSRLMPFFAADGKDNDRQQRRKLLAELSAGTDMHFRLATYAITDAQCDGRGCRVAVSETRDYGKATAGFGRQFDRIVVLGCSKSTCHVTEYKHASSGNTYAGGLSGSTKYSGFYP